MPSPHKHKALVHLLLWRPQEASSEPAYPPATLEAQIKTEYNFTASKDERSTWNKEHPNGPEKTGYELNYRMEICKDTEDDSQIVSRSLHLLHSICRQL